MDGPTAVAPGGALQTSPRTQAALLLPAPDDGRWETARKEAVQGDVWPAHLSIGRSDDGGGRVSSLVGRVSGEVGHWKALCVCVAFRRLLNSHRHDLEASHLLTTATPFFSVGTVRDRMST